MKRDNKTPNTATDSERGKYAKRIKKLSKMLDKAKNLEEKLLILQLIIFYQG
ncbi:hypothetical protein [Lactiplantibacillus plantarum]|uniref:hypothetical protein n=1 Tax=Lactiplantibacillus plantarum TaxID=1590 RepID=UPI0012B3F1D5|nr:hypothetical protein [Lactiplantibacillus plantarum]UQN21531.1 hypothetical protein M3L79_10245 [Lactiplantibacillus plantarum]